MVKIVSLSYYLNKEYQPSVKERIDMIEQTLELNKDTDILLCSEMYITRIENSKFTFVYKEKKTSETKQTVRGDAKDFIGIEQNRIRKSGEYASEPEITDRLIDISNKYPNVLIISGTTLLELLDDDNMTDNKTYILKQGTLKSHSKMNSHMGLSDSVSGGLYDKLVRSSHLRNESGKEEDLTFNYMDKDYEIKLQICADAENSVQNIKFEHPEKLNLRIIISYEFSVKPQIIEGADYDVQIDGGHGLVVYDKVSEKYRSSNANKLHIDTIILTKKPMELSSSHEHKYLKYKNKYLKLKNLMTN